MCTVLLPPDVNPIAVNKYIISYNISYHISYRIVSYLLLLVILIFYQYQKHVPGTGLELEEICMKFFRHPSNTIRIFGSGIHFVPSVPHTQIFLL